LRTVVFADICNTYSRRPKSGSSYILQILILKRCFRHVMLGIDIFPNGLMKILQAGV
jgi:hypothetical protein